MVLREMTSREVWSRFQDLSQRGVLVEGVDKQELASVGFKQFEKVIYAHSLQGDGGLGVAMIGQYLRKLRDDLQFEGVHFSFDESNTCWESLIKNGRARITGFNAALE